LKGGEGKGREGGKGRDGKRREGRGREGKGREYLVALAVLSVRLFLLTCSALPFSFLLSNNA
jgi:hypothetical protein